MSRLDSIDEVRLRWFVAVADELHFARAARALGIARQTLSRTVIELEEELGEKLFVPGAQPTELTATGARLREEARAILAREPDPEPEPGAVRLRVGFVPGVTVSKWERIWGERFPDVPLETLPIPQREQERALRDGAVDMCFVRLPVERDGLSVIPLYRELPVVVVPREHPAAAFEELADADLAGEKRQEGTHIDDAAVTLEMVAAGVGLVVVPHSIARLHARRDLVYRTVTDLPPTEVALAWPAERTTDAVEDFVGVVRGRTANSSRSARAEQPKDRARSANPRGGAQGTDRKRGGSGASRGRRRR